MQARKAQVVKAEVPDGKKDESGALLVAYNEVPMDYPLNRIMLPNSWVLYLYEKQLYTKLVKRPNFQAKPHKQICEINTVNDLMYILHFMRIKVDPRTKEEAYNNPDINLDSNDYIIMRKGIEPIWEDPRNLGGGCFSVQMDHSKGYDVWSTLVMLMLGETLTTEMEHINGITASYIDHINNDISSEKISGQHTYIKIWDAKPNRTRNQFIEILPPLVMDKIKNESMRYVPFNAKPLFGNKDIVDRLNNRPKRSSRDRNYVSGGRRN